MPSFTHTISEHATRLSMSGTTPADLTEASYPEDCPGCVWVMVHLGVWRLKFCSGRCPNHGLASGFRTIPWHSRNGYWTVGRQS